MSRAPDTSGLKVIQTCLACPVREQRLFCNLGPEALQVLTAIRQTSVYPPGAVLFVEGEAARGLFVLCSGQAKLTTSSPHGRSVIVRVADAGEVLGLSAVIANHAYEVSAETVAPSQVNFLPQADFLRFLQENGEVSLRVAEHLSMELRRAYHQVARIALAPSARAKLAGLLLDWSSRDGRPASKGVSFHLPLTHEEMGEIIGSSRETVTRLLADFRRRGLIRIRGTSVTVADPSRLKTLLA